MPFKTNVLTSFDDVIHSEEVICHLKQMSLRPLMMSSTVRKLSKLSSTFSPVDANFSMKMLACSITRACRKGINKMILSWPMCPYNGPQTTFKNQCTNYGTIFCI